MSKTIHKNTPAFEVSFRDLMPTSRFNCYVVFHSLPGAGNSETQSEAPWKRIRLGGGWWGGVAEDVSITVDTLKLTKHSEQGIF